MLFDLEIMSVASIESSGTSNCVDSTEPSILSIPYLDPQMISARKDKTLYPNGVKYDDVPLQFAPQSVVDDFLESIRVSNKNGTAFQNLNGDFFIKADLINSLLKSGNLRKVPRNIQALLATTKTVLKPDQFLQVAQNSEFVPLWNGRTAGLSGNKEAGTQVLVSNNSAVQFPANYYASDFGFAVSCVRV